MSRLQVIDLEEEYKRNSLLKRQDMNTLREFFDENHSKSTMSDFEIFLCLHSCYYNMELAKKTINCFVKLRFYEWTNAFKNRNPIAVRNSQLDISVYWLVNDMIRDHHVFYLALGSPDSAIFEVDDLVKLFLVYIDMMSLEVGNSKGFEFMLDFKNYGWKHLAKTKLSTARKVLQYVQEAFPVRIKSIHLVNSWAVVDKLLYLCKWFMSKEFYEIIHVHTTMESLEKHIPLTMLPQDYGGNQPSAKDMHANLVKFFETNSDLCKE